MKMEISVIIPTYKPDYYIWECLESLKNQSLDNEKYEVLIILNGELDSYYQDINRWLKSQKVKNFKLFYTEKKGVSNARNIGLDNSKGEYIVFIDDDDYIDRNYLEELLNKNKEIGKNGIVIANYINFEEKTQKILYESKYELKKIEKNICKMRKIFSMGCVKIIPKNVIKGIRFNIKFKNGEDALFLLQISKNIESIGIINNQTFYYRRVRKESMNFRKKAFMEILKNILELEKTYIYFFFSKNYNKKFVILRMLAVLKGGVFQIINSRGNNGLFY